MARPRKDLAVVWQDNPMSAVAQSVGLTLPEEIPALWEYATHHANMSAMHAAATGFALTALKEQLNHGAFEKGCEERGFTRFRSREFMAIADLMKRVSEEPNVRTGALLEMGKKKLLELAALPEETLQQIIDDTEKPEAERQGSLTLDDVDCMSVRELKQELRAVRRKAANLHEQYREVEVELMDAKKIMAGKHERALSPALLKARVNGMALTEGVQIRLTDLGRLRDDLLNPASWEHIEASEVNDSYKLYYLNVKAIWVQAAALYEETREMFGLDITTLVDDAADIPHLSDEELAQLQYALEQVRMERNDEIGLRNAVAGVENMPKGPAVKRGRPKNAGPVE
jgi:hypothetical protein